MQSVVLTAKLTQVVCSYGSQGVKIAIMVVSFAWLSLNKRFPAPILLVQSLKPILRVCLYHVYVKAGLLADNVSLTFTSLLVIHLFIAVHSLQSR